MKKILHIPAVALLALPLTVGSVTWQMDSAPIHLQSVAFEHAQSLWI